MAGSVGQAQAQTGTGAGMRGTGLGWPAVQSSGATSIDLCTQVLATRYTMSVYSVQTLAFQGGLGIADWRDWRCHLAETNIKMMTMGLIN